LEVAQNIAKAKHDIAKIFPLKKPIAISLTAPTTVDLFDGEHKVLQLCCSGVNQRASFKFEYP
jgi:hypothetical protein